MVVGIIMTLIGAALAFIAGYLLSKKQVAKAFEDAEDDSKSIIAEAKQEADRLVKEAVKEAKDDARKRRQSFEEESKKRRSENQKLENKIKQKEQSLDKKLSILEGKEAEVDTATAKLQEDKARYQRLSAEAEDIVQSNRKTLERLAGMSADEAKRELTKSIEEEAKKDAAQMIKQIEEQAKDEANQKARSMLSLAVQRISSEHVNDTTVSVVSLPSEDMKGRIIGREGRNIRAIEETTGVDVIIDDTPEAVIISCFNPVRREIGKITLERLVADGRIHPARIEETCKRVASEFDQIIRDHGEQAALDTGITDLHPELIKKLGELKYRTTGQQSVLQHSVEVSHICGILAAEMGADEKVAKRCALLHDVGKSVDQETEGHHADIGAELCKKYGESDTVSEAIRLHHVEDLNSASPYAVILSAANTLSGRRPGARKEALASYVKRLENMEGVIKSFPSIKEAYVIQAGREVRAMVNPTGVADQEVISFQTISQQSLEKSSLSQDKLRLLY